MVVGSAQTNRYDCRGQIINRAFRWQGGTMSDLGTLGGPSSSASAINNAGQIVGRADSMDGASLPFLWEDGTLYLVGDETWESGSAHSINEIGQILINASILIGYRDPDPGPWEHTDGGTAPSENGEPIPILDARVFLASPWHIAPPTWAGDAELTATEIGAGHVSLAWDAATHRDGVTGYRLFRDGEIVAEIPGGERSLTVSGLAAETDYQFKVEAGAANDRWSGLGPSSPVRTLEGPAQPDSFDDWLAAHFDEEERADPERVNPEGDPGGFGIANLLRYAFVLDPREPDRAGLPQVSLTDSGEGGPL